MVRRVFLILFAVYLLGFCAHAAYLKKTVYGDGIFYYSWLRSIVVDHDINFTNEYAYFHANQPRSPLGIPGNKYTVGPAILWAPAFVWTRELVHGNGFEFPYQFVVGLMSVLYTFTGLILLFLLLSRYFGKITSLVTTIAIAGASNLFFYGSLDTVNSHAVSFFAATVFLSFLFQRKRSWFLIGCTLGLIGLIRTQDLIIGLIALPFLSRKNLTHFLIGSVLVFLPQLFAWQLVYGKFWTSPYVGTTEGFNFLQPHVLGVLFSLQNGLFLWTPIVLLGFIGLFNKYSKLPIIPMIAVVIMQIYLVSSWSTWWQGASYSGRMFVSILPIIAIGLAQLFSSFERKRFRYLTIMYAITLPLIVINMIMIIFFLLTV